MYCAGSIYDNYIITSEDVSSANLEENLDEIDLDEEYSTPQRKKKTRLRSRGRPNQKKHAGSDDDEGDLSADSISDDINDSDDTATDQEEEIPTSESDEEIAWQPPQNWESLCRKVPELKRYACIWTKVGDRTSLRELRSHPDQKPKFHVKPTGLRPFAKLFLDACPATRRTVFMIL